jgi:hypothetical protein
MPRKNDPQYVTRSECQQISTSIREELKTIRIALVGENMRGGLVKDVADLKKERSAMLEIVKTVAVPIIIAVATAIILTRL